jgi:hypothetical protein
LLSSRDVNANIWLSHGLDLGLLIFLRALYTLWKHFIHTRFQVFTAVVDQLGATFLRFLHRVVDMCAKISEARTASICRVTKSNPRGCWSPYKNLMHVADEVHVNQIQSSWKWRPHLPPKRRNTSTARRRNTKDTHTHAHTHTRAHTHVPMPEHLTHGYLRASEVLWAHIDEDRDSCQNVGFLTFQAPDGPTRPKKFCEI